MNYESNRLSTFTNWPSSAAVDPIRIAKAGFFSTGQGVEVQCFSCAGKISDWNCGDQVMARHRRLDANCPFVLDPQSSGNVALVLDPQCPGRLTSTANTDSGTLGNQYDFMDLVHDYGMTEEDEIYKSDALRLLSFVNWEDSSISREELVRVGFYHIGEGRLRCAFCGGELARMRQLGSLGDPLSIHQRYFPNCAHALELAARDEAARARDFAPAAPPPRVPSPPAEPAPPAEHNNDIPVQIQSEGARHNQRVLSGHNTWRALGVVEAASGARHATRAPLAARLATYTMWPRDKTQTPEDMAEAGFFYTGSEDQVRCFYCDGGLGKWESGDQPWREHARWFPHCGFLLLLKGRQFVDTHRAHSPHSPRTFPSEAGSTTRRLTSNGGNFNVTESQITEQMESTVAAAALGAGLDAARVRRAIVRRFRTTGLPFTTSESLIDAVLDEQLNEEAWSVSPARGLANGILEETLREYVAGNIPLSTWDYSTDSRQSEVDSPAVSPVPQPTEPARNVERPEKRDEDIRDRDECPEDDRKPISLEEENRQLKEARLCKVCMDGEVSVVFLPCGHLVSCACCGAGLAACPLCRARVQARVRAYLA